MNHIKRIFKMYEQYIGWSVLGLVGIIGMMVGVIPGIKMSLTLYTDIASLRKETDTLSKKIQVLSSYTQDVLQTTVGEMRTALPPDKSVGTLFGTIDGVAQKAGVTVTSLGLENIGSLATDSAAKVVKDEAKTGANTLTANVTVEGELSSIRSFLDELVNVRRLLRLRNFDLTLSEKTNLISSRLVVDTYYLSNPVILGKPSDPLEPISSTEQQTLEKMLTMPVMYEINTFSGSASDNSINPDPFAP